MSIALFEKKLAWEPFSIPARRRLAQTYQLAGKPEESQRVLDETLEIELAELVVQPDVVILHLSLARTYSLLEMNDRAQHHVDRGLELATASVTEDPRNPRNQFELSHAYASAGRLEEALEHATGAFEAESGSFEYRRLRLVLERDIERSRHLPVPTAE